MKVNIMKCDVVSDSGYIYSKEVMQKAIDVFNDTYNEENECYCSNEPSIIVDTTKLSHCIYNMTMDEDGVIMVDLDILETFHGKIIQTLLDSGVELKSYSKGIARVKDNIVIEYEYKSVQLTAI